METNEPMHPDVVALERRWLEQSGSIKNDVAEIKGLLNTSIEANRVQNTQTNRRIDAIEGHVEKAGDRNRLTWISVVGVAAAAIGIMQYLDNPKDRERTTNKERIEKMEDAQNAVASNRHTREDQDSFAKEMAKALASHHLVISRAGAITLAEICAAGRPTLLVPLTLAAGHQLGNGFANVVVKGCAYFGGFVKLIVYRGVMRKGY